MTANGTSGRTDLGPRLDLRRKTQQRARRKRAIIIGAALVVLAVLAWVALFSSALATREVTVTGTQLTTTDEIVQTARVPLGTPLTRIPADAIRQRLLALPEVADVKTGATVHLIDQAKIPARLGKGSTALYGIALALKELRVFPIEALEAAARLQSSEYAEKNADAIRAAVE